MYVVQMPYDRRSDGLARAHKYTSTMAAAAKKRNANKYTEKKWITIMNQMFHIVQFIQVLQY